MQVRGIGVQQSPVQNRPGQKNQKINFGHSFVTLAEANSGKFLRDKVVKPFNKGLLKKMQAETTASAETIVTKVNAKMPGIIKKASDLVEKVNFFALAAGKGSRFEELAIKSGNEPNKVAVKFPINNKESLAMLDLPLAAGKHFAGPEGHKTILATEKTGSLGDIVNHYLQGNEIKDTVVRCGDNVFGNSAEEMTEFLVKTINNPKKHLALVGVKRKPEEVAKRFGVLKVEPQKDNPNVMSLTGFEEKPPLEVAKKLTTPDGNNIANTGMLYISKDAMTKLIDKIKKGDNPIKKNDTEKYDFAIASKYIHKNMEELLDVKPSEGSDVKIVEKWEDVGEPKAYYRFLDEMKEKGTFLQNFPKDFASKVKKALDEKTELNGSDKAIVFNKKINSLKDVPERKKNDAPIIDGVKIIS